MGTLFPLVGFIPKEDFTVKGFNEAHQLMKIKKFICIQIVFIFILTGYIISKSRIPTLNPIGYIISKSGLQTQSQRDT